MQFQNSCPADVPADRSAAWRQRREAEQCQHATGAAQQTQPRAAAFMRTPAVHGKDQHLPTGISAVSESWNMFYFHSDPDELIEILLLQWKCAGFP